MAREPDGRGEPGPVTGEPVPVPVPERNRPVTGEAVPVPVPDRNRPAPQALNSYVQAADWAEKSMSVISSACPC